MASPVRLTRQKISTTVAPDTAKYLEKLVSTGEADTLAQAIDLVVNRIRAAENRERLERATAEYFHNMSPEEEAEENRLALALSQAAKGVDFDREP